MSTDVLSDPTYDQGHGERTFIHLLGVAAEYYAEDIPDAFFQAIITAFGGTALVPHLHEALTEMLQKAYAHDAITIVNLVYDFYHEMKSPGAKWLLGRKDDAYPYIDLLVADKEEALHTSGKADIKTAIQYFLEKGVGAVVVTEGAHGMHLATREKNLSIFKPSPYQALPVCDAIDEEIQKHPEQKGDTTGCGDNFTGGLIANIAEQLLRGGYTTRSSIKKGCIDLLEASMWATVAGGFTCFIVGGTYYEKGPGEKRQRIVPYLELYKNQLKEQNIL
ncbi:MAG TPA: carbohydrate kinase family protein [Spirochaetales bacterium]|nr:carbohydrate kinase family protein [Spirochaetales bacterium]